MMRCLICIERRKGVTQVQQSTSTRWPEQIGATVRWERRWRTQTECGKKCANVREVAENHQVRDTSKQMEPLVFKPFIWQAGSPYRPGMKAFGLMKGWGLWLKHYTIQQSLLKSQRNVSVCKTLHTLQSRTFFFGSAKDSNVLDSHFSCFAASSVPRYDAISVWEERSVCLPLDTVHENIWTECGICAQWRLSWGASVLTNSQKKNIITDWRLLHNLKFADLGNNTNCEVWRSLRFTHFSITSRVQYLLFRLDGTELCSHCRFPSFACSSKPSKYCLVFSLVKNL